MLVNDLYILSIGSILFFFVFLFIRKPFFPLPLHIDTGFFVSNHTIQNRKINYSKGWSASFAGCSKVIPELFYSVIYLFNPNKYPVASRFYYSIFAYITSIIFGFLIYTVHDSSIISYFIGLVFFSLLLSEPHYGVYFENSEQFEIFFIITGWLLIELGFNTSILLMSIGFGLILFNAFFVKLASFPIAITIGIYLLIIKPFMILPISMVCFGIAFFYLIWIKINNKKILDLFQALRGQQKFLSQRPYPYPLKKRVQEKAQLLLDIWNNNIIFPLFFGTGLIIKIISTVNFVDWLVIFYSIGAIITYVIQGNRVWYYSILFIPMIGYFGTTAAITIFSWSEIGAILLLSALFVVVYRQIIIPRKKDRISLNNWVWKLHNDGPQIQRNLIIEKYSNHIKNVINGNSVFIFGAENQLYSLINASYPTAMISAYYWLDSMRPTWKTELIAQFKANPPKYLIESFLSVDINSLENAINHRYELIHDYQEGLRLYQLAEPLLSNNTELNNSNTPSNYLVTAIVSTYKSEKFIRGCLEDLENQTIADKTEIIVIDSASPECEGDIVREFQEKYSNIRYFRTPQRESLYKSWNRAIKMATGKYITTANTDDRHRSDALEIMSNALNQNQDIHLVYADCFESTIPNETFDQCFKTRRYHYPDYFPPSSLLAYQFGPQPMWKKEIHDKLGYFNEEFQVVGDYDFNIRFAFNYQAFHINQPLGLYLKHNASISFRDNSSKHELKRIHDTYRKIDCIFDLYKNAGFSVESPLEKSQILNDLGCRAIEFYTPWDGETLHRDYGFAMECFQNAINYSPNWLPPVNNLAGVSFSFGNNKSARDLLNLITSKDKVVHYNLRVLDRYFNASTIPPLFKFISSSLLTPTENQLHLSMKNCLKLDKTIEQGVGKSSFNILFVVHGFPPNNLSGTEIYTYNLAKELVTQGYKITVLFPINAPNLKAGSIIEEVYDGIKILKLNIPAKHNLDELFYQTDIYESLVQFLQKNSFSLVHIHHLLGFSISIIPVLKTFNLPIILTAHDEWLICEQCHLINADGNYCNPGPISSEYCAMCFLTRNRLPINHDYIQKIVGSFVSRRCNHLKNLLLLDKILIPSRFVLDIFQKHGFDHPDLEIFPLGIKKLSLPQKQSFNGKLRITYIGNIMYTKGLDTLIQAANQLPPDRFMIRIYGKIFDPNYFKYVMSLANTGVNIEYKGAYTPEDLPKILSETDIAVNPSRSESYSFTIRECLECKVPVIASRVGGIPEIIQDGVNGYLFTAGDPNDLARKINIFIQNPYQIQSIRDLITPVLSIFENVKALENIYSDTIKRNSTYSNISTFFVTEQNNGTIENDALVDVVIPIYGHSDLVEKCVNSLIRTNMKGQIYLVDDCSPGDEIKRLFSRLNHLPNLRMINNETNQGFIGSSKIGASNGNAPYILFLNSDTEAIDPGWIERMIPDDPNVAIVGAKLLYPPTFPDIMKGKIQHAGVARDNQIVPYHIYCGWEESAPEVNRKLEVNAVTGGCLLIRRKVWEELGGWDDHFGRGVFEDVDLCWRAREKGYKVIYNPEVRLYHHEHGSTLADGSHSLHIHGNENIKYLKEKWHYLDSDEDIFLGKKEAQNIKNSLMLLKSAHNYLNQGLIKEFEDELTRSVRVSSWNHRALVGLGQVYTAKSLHNEAIAHFQKALSVKPFLWEVRLKIVEEFTTLNRLEEAALELIPLLTLFPNDPKVLQAAIPLSGHLTLLHNQQRQEKIKKNNLEDKSDPSQKSNQYRYISSKSPQDVFEELLAAEDISAALLEHQSELNQGVLDLVQENIKSARLDSEFELAEGLEALAEQIRSMITSPNNPLRNRLPASEVLEALLSAEDISEALKNYRPHLDQGLIDLIFENIQSARQDGETELAEGLENLAEIIKEITTECSIA